MRMLSKRGAAVAVVAIWVTVIALVHPNRVFAADEQRFPVLQIGTRTYENVTVTTKTKDYIFLLHSTGMASIKVKDLPADLRHKLGYVDPPPPKTAASTANEWARSSLNKLETPQLKAAESELKQAWATRSFRGVDLGALFTRRTIYIAGAAMGAIFLFFSYCFRLICEKAGKKPGMMVWLPILQSFPLLDAAGMPAWWFLVGLIPGLNLVAGIVWCFKITQARGKSPITAVLLLVPILGIFALLNLAFSDSPRPVREKRRVEIMTLEAA